MSIHLLKRLIKEVIYQTETDLEETIAAMGPDDIAIDDYVDSDTGEIVLEKGKLARSCPMHPQYTIDRQEKQAARDAELIAMHDEWDKDDAEYEAEEERIKAGRIAEYEAAVKEFAEGAADFVSGNPDVDPSDVATDMAENFFHVNVSWMTWARTLGISKAEMKSAVSEACYEVMINAS